MLKRKKLYRVQYTGVSVSNTYVVIDDGTQLLQGKPIEEFNTDVSTVTWSEVANKPASITTLDTARTINDLADPEKISVDFAGRLLNDDGTKNSLDWNNREATDLNEILSINWQARILSDALQVSSIEWDSRILKDSTNQNSISYNTRLLQDSTGVQSVDWQDRILKDVTGGESVDYTTRVLYDVNQNAVYNYNTQSMQNLQTFTNNADALLGGLVDGQLYKTATGEIRIVV